MEFDLSEEQQQMKLSVREFAEGEIAPHVMEWDEAQHFPIELQPKLAELGLLGILFPEDYGGAGLGYIEYATVIVPVMSSVRSVELVVVPPPHAASSVASSVSAADQTPSRLPGFLNGLPPQEISSDLVVAPRASGSPWRSDRPRAESLVRASPTDLSVSTPAA